MLIMVVSSRSLIKNEILKRQEKNSSLMKCLLDAGSQLRTGFQTYELARFCHSCYVLYYLLHYSGSQSKRNTKQEVYSM